MAPYRILIADPDFRPYYRKVESCVEQCRVTAKADCEAACGFFLQHPADIVLLSHPDHAVLVKMVRFFRAHDPFVPVIALTGNGSESLAVTLFRNGVKDYLRKPIEDEELRASLLSALRLLHPPDDHQPSGQGGQIDRAITFIHEHYHDHIALEDVARELGMSVSSFCRVFRKATGTTFRKYVNRYRITRAADLLRSEGRSMSEIAFACGFTNQFHFCRIFRNIMKAPPTEYRKHLH